MKRILFLLATLLCILQSNATQIVKIDDICYNIDWGPGKASVVPYNKYSYANKPYSGDIVIPKTISYNDKTYTVTYIEKGAFKNCSTLTSLTIPSSLTSIEDLHWGANETFSGCTMLKTFYVEKDNKVYCAQDGVLFNSEKTILYRCPPALEGDYKIPSITKEIGNMAFVDCYMLQSVVIPNSVTTIGNFAFQSCHDLLIWINDNTSLYIDNYTFSGLGSKESIIIAPATLIDKIKENWKGQVLDIDKTPCVVTSVQVFAKGCTFSIYPKPTTTLNSMEILALIEDKKAEKQGDGSWIVKGLKPNTEYQITLKKAIKVEGQQILQEIYSRPITTSPISVSLTHESLLAAIQIKSFTATTDTTAKPRTFGVIHDGIDYPANDGKVNITNLGIASNVLLQPYVIYDDGEKVLGQEQTLYTKTAKLSCRIPTKTATTAQIQVTCDNIDASINIEKFGIYFNYNTKEYDGKNNIKLTELKNNTKYVITPFITYNGNKEYRGTYSTFTTNSILPIIKATRNTPTLIEFDCSHSIQDAKLKNEWVEFLGNKYTSFPFYVKGLTNNRTYEAVYKVQTTCGVIESQKITVKTPAIKFVTLQPQGVSSTSSIVAAETNISEEETNVGFQWKKTDAPSGLSPREGYATITDGRLEGFIKNLQSTSYYNVRPFYKTEQGDYYYGAWVTFDPSDFSYFQPTVRTYDASNITDHSATLNGYVMPGTEDIIEQGFEYWQANNSQQTKMKCVAFQTTQTKSDIITITAQGLRMSTQITELQSCNQYYYRSYVKTPKGIIYGQERNFTTTLSTGIMDAETNKPSVIGIYTLDGIRVNSVDKGIYIIKYSNGETIKIYK